mmetsp:Transcript_59002/g.183184  ORF Transcript_59002/g.183184 Transcript_59002/m.183184 type:complete len:308 (-) Transcript_59002:127-1050(-)
MHGTVCEERAMSSRHGARQGRHHPVSVSGPERPLGPRRLRAVVAEHDLPVDFNAPGTLGGIEAEYSTGLPSVELGIHDEQGRLHELGDGGSVEAPPSVISQELGTGLVDAGTRVPSLVAPNKLPRVVVLLARKVSVQVQREHGICQAKHLGVGGHPASHVVDVLIGRRRACGAARVEQLGGAGQAVGKQMIKDCIEEAPPAIVDGSSRYQDSLLAVACHGAAITILDVDHREGGKSVKEILRFVRTERLRVCIRRAQVCKTSLVAILVSQAPSASLVENEPLAITRCFKWLADVVCPRAAIQTHSTG